MRIPPLRITIGRLMAGMAVGSLCLTCLMYASSPWAKCCLSLALGILTIAILGAIYGTRVRRAYWNGFILCGWAYLVVAFGPWFSASIRPHLATSELLTWAYPLLVPEMRRPDAYVENLTVSLIAPSLGQGLTVGDLGTMMMFTTYDVWATAADGTRSIMAENVQVVGLSPSGNTALASLDIKTNEVTKASIEKALKSKPKLTLEIHKPGNSAGSHSPPVSDQDFQLVGHPLFALLFAWLGGGAGRYFYGTRERTAAGTGPPNGNSEP